MQVEEIQDIINTSFRAVDFAQKFLPDENEPWNLVKLTNSQIDAIDSIQFGFPLRQFDFNEVEKPPKGVVMIWPRQCVVENTRIQISDGSLKKITDVRDSVISYDKKYIKSPPVNLINNGLKKCLKIKTSQGRTIKCTKNHPFLSCNNHAFMEYKNAGDLKVGDDVAMARNIPDIGKEILTIEEVKFLAYMIAEGSLGIYKGFYPKFTNSDEWIVNDFKSTCECNKISSTITYSVKSRKELLISCGLSGKLSGDKFIPDIIFKSSRKQISSFLSCLINGDGHVYKNGIEYYSKSKQLLKDLLLLFTRIGMYGKFSLHGKYKGNKYYRISFTSSIDLNNAKKYLNLCPRKQSILNSIKTIGNDHNDTFPYWRYVKQVRENFGLTRREFDEIVGFKTYYRYNLSMRKIKIIEEIFNVKFEKNIRWDKIISIEEIGKHQTYGLEVPIYHNHLTNGFITHNTGKTTGVAYGVNSLIFLEPGCSVGIIAATEKQSKKLFNKIKKILKNSILWDFVVKKTVRVDFLELTNGSYIECWPCTDGIEGSTYTYLCMDEAALMDEDIIFKSAMPTVTHGKRWIMLSTPKGPKGDFIDYYYKGLETRPIICKVCGQVYPQAAFTVDHFPNGKIPNEQMHPCINCGHTLYKYGIGMFSVPWVDAWNDGLRDKEDVQRMLDEAGWTPGARQEYLGEIISDASMVFLGEWVKAAVNPKLTNYMKKKQTFSYVAGVDYGKKHDASCFYVTHRNPKNGKIVLDFAMSVAGEYDEQRTYRYIRQKLMKVLTFFDPMWVLPDATGMGDPLVEELEEDLKTTRRSNGMTLKTRIFNNRDGSKGYIISRTSKPELIGNLIKLFSTGMIEIPAGTEPEIGGLIEELLRYECDDVAGSDYIKYGTQSFHDDRVIALALSCWGHRRKPTMVDRIKIRGMNHDILGGYGDYNY